MRVVGKISKDIGMGVRKGTVVPFVPLGIPSLYVSSFFKMFFVTCFRCCFLGGGGGGGGAGIWSY